MTNKVLNKKKKFQYWNIFMF